MANSSASRKEFNRPWFVISIDVLDWYAKRINIAKSPISYSNNCRFHANAFHNKDDERSPRLDFLHNQVSSTIPPCLFIVAELDPLLDDSYRKNK